MGQVAKLADAAEPEALGSGDAAAGDPQEMFAQNVILILTERRLLAFGHGTYTGRVRKLVGEIALTDVATMDLEAPPVGKSGDSSLAITFTDGETVSLTPGSRRRRFIEAFERLGQPA
jgi:hypothetical protein